MLNMIAWDRVASFYFIYIVKQESTCMQWRELLRTVPTIVTVHTFCASGDTRVSYGWCLLLQGYFCAL